MTPKLTLYEGNQRVGNFANPEQLSEVLRIARPGTYTLLHRPGPNGDEPRLTLERRKVDGEWYTQTHHGGWYYIASVAVSTLDGLPRQHEQRGMHQRYEPAAYVGGERGNTSTERTTATNRRLSTDGERNTGEG